MIRRKRLALILIAFFAINMLGTGIVLAADNSNVAPNPSNSTPNTIPGTHVFFMRKSSNWGKNTNLKIDAYYDPASLTTDSQWRAGYIRLRPGGANVNDTWVCQKRDGPRDTSTFPNNATGDRLWRQYHDQYVTVTLNAANGESSSYYISYAQLCAGGQQSHENRPGAYAGNVFFGTYHLPGNFRPALDDVTGYYAVHITIEYNSLMPTSIDNTGNTLRFDVYGNTPGVKIGERGEPQTDDSPNYYAFPLISNAVYQNDGSKDIDIPFGLSCDVPTGNYRIGLFDADNGSAGSWPATLSFKVREKGGGYLNLFGARGGSTDGTKFTPADGEKQFASVNAHFVVGKKYVMEINNIWARNIIDVHVPGDTIFGDIGCQWRMDPQTEPRAETARPGETVTWKHTATNVGGQVTPSNITITARWGTSGKKTSGVISSIDDMSYDPGQSRVINTSFRIPDNAQNGDKYCQYLRVNHHSSRDSNFKDSEEGCYTVELVTGPTPDRYVNIAPSVNAPDDEEVGNQVRFNGVVTVTGSPSLAAKEWGYGEKAVQLPAQRVQATITSDGTNWSRTRTQYVCPPGYTPSGAQTSPTTCTYTYVWYTWEPAIRGSDGNYSCRSYSGFTGTTSGTGASKLCQVKHTQTYTTASVAQYSYFCTSNNSYTGWTSSTTSTCPKYYQCPNGAAGSGWGGATCEAWQCQYPSAVVLGPNPPICEARCDGGRGNWWAQFSYGQYRDQGDLNCYVQPKFQLTCRWLDAPDFATITINGDGRYDCSSTLKTGEILGAQLCATLRPLMPTAWTSTYAPGWAMDHYEARWSWRISPPTATTCTKITGRPYVKAYTGDVMVGGGVAWGNSGVCTPNSTATIKTFSKDGNLGAGTQYAAFAQGFIDRFVSGQYNPYSATPNVGSPPTALTFANNAGGSGYGGGFGNTGPCINYVGKLPSDAQQLTGNVTLPVQSEKNLGTGQKIVKHVVGNVFINDNITYSGANSNGVWPSSDKIPLFQLVVEGNIYISSSVVQLDGLYAAIPNAAGQGGVIYTCATGIGSVPSDTFGACKQQLAVNGAFAARQIAFLRDCSSLKWSTSYEPPVYQGQTDNQLCSVSNHAAEVFNYTPEQWIRGSAGSPPNKYDAISSMPPVL